MRIALGWLGWSEEQALHTDVNTILVAYEGRKEMLHAIFGGSDSPGKDRDVKFISDPRKRDVLIPIAQMTPDQFDALF